MIRRVLRPTSAAAPALAIAALPPGTSVSGPLQQVFIIPGRAQVGSVPADALVTSDGRPVYATGPGRWGQLAAIGTRG